MENKLIVCDSCRGSFVLDDKPLQEGKIVLDGIGYKLVYFVCPHCDKLYRVTLKGRQYKFLLNNLETAKREINKYRGDRNTQRHCRLVEEVNRAEDRLSTYLYNLNKLYRGTFTLESSVNNGRDKILTYHDTNVDDERNQNG